MLSICRLPVFAGHLEQPVAPLARVRLTCQLQTVSSVFLEVTFYFGRHRLHKCTDRRHSTPYIDQGSKYLTTRQIGLRRRTWRGSAVKREAEGRTWRDDQAHAALPQGLFCHQRP